MDSPTSSARRHFLRTLGLGALTLSLAGCRREEKPTPARGEMRFREHPRTRAQVSLLGYGCMRWPKQEGSEELDQEAINALVDAAIAGGVNYFDTSPAYCKGASERATGIALKRHPRDSFFIATKLSNFAESTWSREKSLEMYHNSFRELQVDAIDYMLLHAVGGGDGLPLFRRRYIDNGILDFLLAEREAGRIRHLGFSFHGDIAVFDYLLSQHEKYQWDFVQIQLNYLDWQNGKAGKPRGQDAAYLYRELAQRDIPVVIMEPLLGGRLAKLPDHIAARLKQREPERSVASWAFRFAGSFPKVLTVLSGMSCMEHLQDNLSTYSPLHALTMEEMNFLHETAELMMQYPTIPCNDCKYCMPCPYGLDIPATLLHYNKCVNEGNIVTGSSTSDYAAKRRAFLIGYDRTVPKLRQAEHCIGCGKCLSHCPQSIDIPQQMQRLARYTAHLRAGTPTVEELAQTLHTLGASLVLSVPGGEVEGFYGRGVADLLNLLDKRPGALRGATAADKVVGKGAAALMAMGGVRELYAGTLSEPALALLKRHGVYVIHGKLVPEIRNRSNTGLCPVETVCADADSAGECVECIRAWAAEAQAPPPSVTPS